MSIQKMKESLKGMGWGYYRIYPKHSEARCDQNGIKANPIRPDLVRKEYKGSGLDYLLVGCEPDTMFQPGEEPEEFRWWWWDNSMMPHLRYVNSTNPTGSKWWSRITYCGWSMPQHTRVDVTQRTRINRRLELLSQGDITEIAQIWGGCVDTRKPKRKHALICASSERNHRYFYRETQADWIARMKGSLDRWGYTYEVRTKVGVEARKQNQTTMQLDQGGFDVLVANHSACASEGVIHGVPVICSSEWNGAHEVSTPWQEFMDKGELKYYTAKQIDDWVTKICAYTYHREELMSNEWIDHHPDADHLRRQK